MEDYFRIRPDTICNYYDGHLVLEVADSVAAFLLAKDMWKETRVLYSDFINRHDLKVWEEKLPDYDQWKNNNFVTGKCCHEMVKQIHSLPDITDATEFNINHYYFYKSSTPGYAPQMGVILNQEIEIAHDIYPRIFGHLFTFILTKTNHPAQFLKAHLTETFKDDRIAFEQFLNLWSLGEHKALLKAGKRTKFLKHWISNDLNKVTEVQGGILPPTYLQVSIAIIFKQKVKSIEDFGNSKNGKENRLKDLAKDHSLKSWNKLQQYYNEFNALINNDNKLKEELSKRKTWDKDQPSIESILENDKKALAYFKKLFQ